VKNEKVYCKAKYNYTNYKNRPNFAILGEAIKMKVKYLKYVISLGGDREFQQCPTFIFYAYTWKMKKRINCVSYLATRGTNSDNDGLSVGDIKALLIYIGKSDQCTDHDEADGDASDNTLDNAQAVARLKVMLGQIITYSNDLPGMIAISPARNVKFPRF
jgi:hypothetical protein